MFPLQNGTLPLADDTMHYVRFGRGRQILVLLPGLGDGLATVKGTALPMAVMYRAFAKDYTVYMFSRRNALSAHATTRDMAHDLKAALDVLGVGQISLIGVSMGGMIAQHFAADYPQMVKQLVLVVTCAQPNPILTESVQEWISLAKQGDHTALMASNLRRIYSEKYCRKNRWLLPIAGKCTKPKSYGRFFIQANACMNHQAADRLSQIAAPTLVIGGGQDLTLGVEASRQIAAAIPNAILKIYPEWGHGVYEEAPDFQQMVLRFLNEGFL